MVRYKNADVVIFKDIKLRFIVSFPSIFKGGGSFNGRQAKTMFEKELTQIARYSLVYPNNVRDLLRRYRNV